MPSKGQHANAPSSCQPCLPLGERALRRAVRGARNADRLSQKLICLIKSPRSDESACPQTVLKCLLLRGPVTFLELRQALSNPSFFQINKGTYLSRIAKEPTIMQVQQQQASKVETAAQVRSVSAQAIDTHMCTWWMHQLTYYITSGTSGAS